MNKQKVKTIVIEYKNFSSESIKELIFDPAKYDISILAVVKVAQDKSSIEVRNATLTKLEFLQNKNHLDSLLNVKLSQLKILDK